MKYVVKISWSQTDLSAYIVEAASVDHVKQIMHSKFSGFSIYEITKIDGEIS